MTKTYSLLFFLFLSGIATIAIMQNQGFFNNTLTNNCQYENVRGNSPHFFSWGNMMTQHPAVQRHFNTTTAQQRYAANFNAAFYPTPNIQIGPNYQGRAPAHFHAATYPTLNIQSGPKIKLRLRPISIQTHQAHNRRFLSSLHRIKQRLWGTGC